MKAAVGDKLIMHGHRVGAPARTATVVEVRGEDGGPPYVVHWTDDSHDPPVDALFFPGSDADVEHHEAAAD